MSESTPQMIELHEITPPETFPFMRPVEAFPEWRKVVKAFNQSMPGCWVNSPVTPDDHKFCTRCRTIKPLTEFHRHSCVTDGRYSHCKVCANENGRMRRQDRMDVAKMTALLAERERYEAEVA